MKNEKMEMEIDWNTEENNMKNGKIKIKHKKEKANNKKIKMNSDRMKLMKKKGNQKNETKFFLKKTRIKNKNRMKKNQHRKMNWKNL